MAPSARVDWRGSDVLVEVGEMASEALMELARRTADEARDVAPKDTGFLKASLYAITRDASDHSQTWETGLYRNREGRMVQRGQVGQLALPDDADAAVHAAALYAIWVEMAAPFLYPAAERVARDAGSVVKEVARDRSRP